MTSRSRPTDPTSPRGSPISSGARNRGLAELPRRSDGLRVARALERLSDAEILHGLKTGLIVEQDGTLLPAISGAATVTGNFNIGPNGTTIATTDAGDATAWDLVTIGALGGSVVYDSSVVHRGTFSGKLTSGTGGSLSALRWVAAFGTQTDHYGRAYLYIPSAPATAFPLIRWLSGATNAAQIRIQPANPLAVRDNTGANVFVFTTATPINQWFRLEWHVVHSTTVGSISVDLYTTADATTPDESSGVVTGLNTLASADRVEFAANAASFVVYFDDLADAAAAPLGPSIKTVTVGTATETDSARTLSARRSRALTKATETDSSRLLAMRKTLTKVSETDTSKPIKQPVAVTTAVEADQVKTLKIALKVVPVVEIDVAQYLHRVIPTSVPLASYVIEVSWSRATAGGYFVLGTSHLGGTDVLAAGAIIGPGGLFGGPYDNLDHDDAVYRTRVIRASWSRGRTRTFDSVEGGKATVEVADPLGLLNPDNPASPLYGQTRDPGRPIRITAKYGALAVSRFFGFVTSIDYRPAGRASTAVLECDDLFVKLDENVTIGTMTNTTTGAVITAIASAIGWSDPTYLAIDAGDPIDLFAEAVNGDVSGLELIGDVLATEFGLAFVDGVGALRFESRYKRRGRAVAAAFRNTFPAIGPGSALRNIVNSATFTKEGSTPQTYTDALSADPLHGYGLRVKPEVVSKYLQGDDAALDRAHYVVNTLKDPTGTVWELRVEGRDPALLTAMLGLEVGYRVTASEAQTGTIGDYYIERLEESIDRATRIHSANYVLSERPTVNLFTLGTSTLGGADILAL